MKQGFTIVELLIVVVVIGILAAITLVSYNGIQNRAKLSSAQALAQNVSKKAQVFYTLQGTYPTLAELTSTTGPQEARLDNPSTVNATAPTAATGTTAVQYAACPTTGTQTGIAFHYWDYVSGSVTTSTSTNKSSIVGTGC